jgi:flagellar hook-length control protein FliK
MTDVTLLLNQIGVANRGESRGQDGASKQGNSQLFNALMAQQSAAKTTNALKSEQSDTKLSPSSSNRTPNDKTTADRGAKIDTVKNTAKDSGSREKVETASEAEKQRDNQIATEREALQPAKNDQPENSSTASQNHVEKSLSDAPQDDQPATTADQQAIADPSLMNNNLLLLSPFTAANSSVETVLANASSDTVSNSGGVNSGLNLSNPISTTTVATADSSLNLNNPISTNTVATADSSLNASKSLSAAENLNTPLDVAASTHNLGTDNPVVSYAPSADTAITTPPTAATAATASPNLTPTVNNPLAASTNDFSPALQQAATDSVAPSTDGKINDRFSENEGKHAGIHEDTEISLTNANPINVVQSPLTVQNTEVAKQATMVPPQAGELAQQVTVAIRKGATEGTSQMHIKLNPVELGGIDIRMEVDADHHVRAILTIEKPETYDLLHKDAQHLQKLLEESGLKLADANAIQYEQRSSSLANNTNSNQDWLSSGWFGQEGGQAGRHAQNDSGYTAARHPGGDGDDAASTPVNLITYTHGQIDGRVNIRV